MSEAEDDLVVRARARTGAVLLAKYRLDRLLGVGGMAAVYEAAHVRLGNRVAIKMLHPELASNASVRDRFLREGYLANAVEHPAVVRVLDDGVADDGSLFLVMELLSGEPLEARWAKQGRKLSVPETVTLMLELLSVLVAAHARQILHRDLKVENLFLASDGRLRVLDFGIARQRVVGGARTLTGADEVFGTPWYMAPEQALGSRDVDARSDLWAVGATAFTLLSGRYVHGDGGESVQQALVFASTKKAPPIRSAVPHISEAVAAVFDRALAFRQEERWPTAAAMRDALAVAQDEMIRASLHGDYAEDDLKTRVGSMPPAMTTSPPERPASVGEHTLPIPTVPVTNTVGGVASDNARLRYPHAVAQALRHLTDAIVHWVEGAHPLARVGNALRRLGSTLAAVTASSTLRYRRRALVAATVGLGLSLALGMIALLALRTSTRASAPATTPAVASVPALPFAQESAAEASGAAAEPETTTAPADPESTRPVPAVTPTESMPVAVPTHVPVALPSPRPPTTPKPQRPKHDPLAP
ncbi:MAG TPA: protein kinase [Candidatus Margulisiibacteriota bacterium]|nr:protein kinase [Candidatus Margulisiibacteriota bacterium]